MTDVTYRVADLTDAPTVAAVHADSWRRHYRGAYADDYLDGDVVADREKVWTIRLRDADAPTLTVVAEHDGAVIGFVHTILDADDVHGALLDNLHVLAAHQRRGIGAQLIARSAAYVARERPQSPLHLWVLQQNERAQRFYDAVGGTPADLRPVPDVGGVPGRLNGRPLALRYVWPQPSQLAQLLDVGTDRSVAQR